MKKKLETFIQGHRKELDGELPPTLTWEQVELSLHASPRKNKTIAIRYWLAAASVMVMLIIGTALSRNQQTHMNDAPVAVKQEEILPPEVRNEIDPVFTSQLYEVAKVIETKQTELKQAGEQYPQLYKQFEKEINELDSTYNNLKNVLTQHPGQEEVLESMIQTLQLELELLNRQLRIIKQLKNTDHENKTT